MPSQERALSRQQWLTWCCAVGGMSVQQTAYSMRISAHSVHRHRLALGLKGRTWPLKK